VSEIQPRNLSVGLGVSWIDAGSTKDWFGGRGTPIVTGPLGLAIGALDMGEAIVTSDDFTFDGTICEGSAPGASTMVVTLAICEGVELRKPVCRASWADRLGTPVDTPVGCGGTTGPLSC
jgi:hypothetical protein